MEKQTREGGLILPRATAARSHKNEKQLRSFSVADKPCSDIGNVILFTLRSGFFPTVFLGP